MEIYINPKFKPEAAELKDRVRNFNYFQVVSPEEFHSVNARNQIKFANNPYFKKFHLLAN